MGGITLNFSDPDAGGKDWQVPRYLEDKVGTDYSTHLDFKVKGEKHCRNLDKLIFQQPGTLFTVDEGELQKVKGLRGRICYFFRKTKHQKEVDAVVRQTLLQLNGLLKRNLQGADETTIKTYRLVISELFSPHGTLHAYKAHYQEKRRAARPLSLMMLPEGNIRVCFDFADKNKVYFDVPSQELDQKSFEEFENHLPLYTTEFDTNNLDFQNLYLLMGASRGQKFKAIPVTETNDEDEEIVVGYQLEKVSSFYGRISYGARKLLRKEDQKIQQAKAAALKAWNDDLELRDEQDATTDLILKAQSYVARHLFSEYWSLNVNTLSQDSRLSLLALEENTVRLQFKIKEDNYKYLDVRVGQNEHTLRLLKMCLDTDDETLNYNFYKLLKRKRTEVYTVDPETKMLKRVKGFRKTVSYVSNYKSEKKKVQICVTKVLRSLNREFREENCPYLQLEDENLYRTTFRHFFMNMGSLYRMSTAVYDRGAIKETHIDESLQIFLNPEYVAIKQELKDALMDLRDVLNSKEVKELRKLAKTILVDGDEGEDQCNLDRFYELLNDGTYTQARERAIAAFFDLVYAEFDFARKLGQPVDRVGDGGSGGARYACSRFGEKILVIKPDDEGPHGRNNPQWYAPIKRRLMSGPAALKGNKEPTSEELSYIFQRSLGIVPPTEQKNVRCQDFVGASFKKCSAQMFVKDAEPLRAFFGLSVQIDYLPRRILRPMYKHLPNSRIGRFFNPKLESVPHVDTELLTRIALHNFMFGDIDCHFDNVLVKKVNTNDLSPVAKLFKPIEFQEEKRYKISDKAIATFIDHLFHPKGKETLSHQQQLLQSLFAVGTAWEHDGYDEEREEQLRQIPISLIKHDGGAGFTRKHPEGYMESRFRFLFEVLPQFGSKATFFPAEATRSNLPYLIMDDTFFCESLDTLIQKQLQDTVCNQTIYQSLCDSDDVDVNDWVQHIAQLVTGTDDQNINTHVKNKRKAIEAFLVQERLKAAGLGLHRSPDEQETGFFAEKRLKMQEKFIKDNCNFHMRRVEGIIKTTMVRWIVLQYALQENWPKRKLLKIRTKEDFKKAMAEIQKDDSTFLEDLKTQFDEYDFSLLGPADSASFSSEENSS